MMPKGALDNGQGTRSRSKGPGSCVHPQSDTEPNPPGPHGGGGKAAQYLRGHQKSKLKQTRGEGPPFPNQKAPFCSLSPLSQVVTPPSRPDPAPPGCLPGPGATRSHAGLSQDKPGLRCANGATTFSPPCLLILHSLAVSVFTKVNSLHLGQKAAKRNILPGGGGVAGGGTGQRLRFGSTGPQMSIPPRA